MVPLAVFGASGTTGAEVVPEALAHGLDGVAVHRTRPGPAALRPAGARQAITLAMAELGVPPLLSRDDLAEFIVHPVGTSGRSRRRLLIRRERRNEAQAMGQRVVIV